MTHPPSKSEALSLIPFDWFEAVQRIARQIQNMDRRQGAVAHFTPLLGGGMEFRLEMTADAWEEATNPELYKFWPSIPETEPKS